MIYLFTDRGTDGSNGTEYISNIKPTRFGHISDSHGNDRCFMQNEDGSVSGMNLGIPGGARECPGSKEDLSYWRCGDVFDPKPVELPCGSIERLLGHKLSFWDEPVELSVNESTFKNL